MREVMPRIKPGWVDQIFVVDGGSTDGTAEYARKMGYAVILQKKKGLRNAYMETLPFVQAEAVITFSPDGNCVPEVIPLLKEKMQEGYDMVIASRYAKGAKSYDDDPITAFGNWFFTATVNLLFGVRYTDVMGIFRAYKKQIIYDLGLDKDSSYQAVEKVFCTDVSWEPLLSARAAKRKLKVLDIPADEPRRVGGDRKLQVIRWGAAYYSQFIKEALTK